MRIIKDTIQFNYEGKLDLLPESHAYSGFSVYKSKKDGEWFRVVVCNSDGEIVWVDMLKNWEDFYYGPAMDDRPGPEEIRLLYYFPYEQEHLEPLATELAQFNELLEDISLGNPRNLPMR